MLLIIGDWNAKFSAAHVRFAHDKCTNENGFKLLDLVYEKSLCITSARFEKHIGKRWTFEDPKGKHYLLDYTLINEKWKNAVMNSEAYSSFASVGSDHRVVTAKVCLSLRTTKARSSKTRHDWSLLRHDHALQNKFKLELTNRYNALFDETLSATEQYDAFVKANEYAAAETLPPVRCKKEECFSNCPTIVALRKKIEKLSHSYAVKKSTVLKRHLTVAKRKLNEEYHRLEREKLSAQIAEIEIDMHNNNTGKA